MRRWALSKLKYTCQAFQEGVIGKLSISFGPRIRPANSGQNPFHTRDSNGKSWVYDIEIRWFKNQNSSTDSGL
jgi:hypothetical protein